MLIVQIIFYHSEIKRKTNYKSQQKQSIQRSQRIHFQQLNIRGQKQQQFILMYEIIKKRNMISKLRIHILQYITQLPTEVLLVSKLPNMILLCDTATGSRIHSLFQISFELGNVDNGLISSHLLLEKQYLDVYLVKTICQ
ncbi:Hypothetical_protein [Hexamita inflata]|uniref:Hypothetical_protein n=1 Tax=Hexamita inflata TaxID=28002 RepID=A0ABP1GEX9_9EUKA